MHAAMRCPATCPSAPKPLPVFPEVAFRPGRQDLAAEDARGLLCRPQNGAKGLPHLSAHCKQQEASVGVWRGKEWCGGLAWLEEPLQLQSAGRRGGLRRPPSRAHAPAPSGRADAPLPSASRGGYPPAPSTPVWWLITSITTRGCPLPRQLAYPADPAQHGGGVRHPGARDVRCRRARTTDAFQAGECRDGGPGWQEQCKPPGSGPFCAALTCSVCRPQGQVCVPKLFHQLRHRRQRWRPFRTGSRHN